jgi:aryl-phospho-beta-D-glucosidase BglC (GH1 family)
MAIHRQIYTVIGLFLFGSSLSSSLQAAPQPFLMCSGLDVRNDYGEGDVVPLRGVNLGGWLLMEPWMCPMDSSGNLDDDWSVRDTLTQRFGAAAKDSLIDAYQDAWLQESDFDNIAALGMNCVRLPFWYMNVQEEDGTWRTDAFDRLDWAISNAWERGIYTIIDLHGAPGGQRANADTTGRIWPTAALWSSTTYQNRTLDIWERVSQHYNGNPAVAGYDLLNEPMDTPGSTDYWNFMEACYQTVRANDPDHIIIMEATYGQWNLDMLPDPALYGWSNVVYQLHHYPWDYWNDVTALNAGADAKVQDWLDHSSWNVPCHMGEFNMAPEAAWKYAIETYSDSGMGWMMWAYKSTFTGGTTSWGVYNPNGSVTAVPNIQSDSSSSISNKWSQWTTAGGFSLNQSHKRTLSMPVATDDAYTLSTGAVLNVSADGVLDNDTHLNLGGAGIQLEAVKISDPANGTVVLNSDGTFNYTANGGFQGIDSFRYKVWDGRIDSTRNATVSIHVISNTVAGPITQLIWTGQPGLATNGVPFVQQPVLVSADQYGVLSTNGLPALLDVVVTLTSGTGPLLGTTNINIGTAGYNGVVSFTDLQIDSVGTDKELTAMTTVLSNAPASGNLLTNGDFNAALGSEWTIWQSDGSGWVNRETLTFPMTGSSGTLNAGVYDGTLQMTLGAAGGGAGARGIYQTVAATAGEEYTLNLDAGAQNWWWPSGGAYLKFLDSGGGELASHAIDTTADFSTWDDGVEYQAFSVSATAPAGTAHIKVELAEWNGTGSVWFDNIELVEQGSSAPILRGATTLPFTVHAYAPPIGQTNYIESIAFNGDGTITLQLVGTMGYQYVVMGTADLEPPVWVPMPGGTNLVTSTNGQWSCIVTNHGEGSQFFRSFQSGHE